MVQVTSDQIFGTFTFSIEIGRSSACARKPGRSRSDLKPMWTVNGEMARSNGDLIRKAREIVENAGRRPASVAEARELLGTPRRVQA